ncbi:MAG: hypothetical protein AABZ61_09005, partial [Bacteroidota bacterium]
MSVSHGYLIRSLPIVLVFSLTEPSAPAFSQVNNPVADPSAIVVNGQVRFTVLTPQLIRMEWAEDGRFEDQASLVFINRRITVPPFKESSDGEWLITQTDKLVLKYSRNSGKFSPDNLQIEFDLNGRHVVWHPGLADTGNLRGTTRTLDGVKGSRPLEPGLLSRDGWVLVDDSERPLFDTSDWPWVPPRTKSERQDIFKKIIATCYSNRPKVAPRSVVVSQARSVRERPEDRT